MFSKLKGYRRLKEQKDEEKKYQEYKDNWVKKGDGTYDNKGYTQEEKYKVNYLFILCNHLQFSCNK